MSELGEPVIFALCLTKKNKNGAFLECFCYRSILPTSIAYIPPSTRGCSPWRPDAVMSTTGRQRYSILRIFKGRRGRIGHHQRALLFEPLGPIEPFPRWVVC
ncbi:hypothetical protein Scep_028005 [Stephania cephalantha]|uniref:Uncharacterized protein n=1 Tax=Stephania cephalantha TaxID=152367 RepID=A0AAP0ECG4_9MAGN